MIVIRIPKKVVLVFPMILLIIAVGFLGKHYTPKDSEGNPIIISPSIWKIEGYKRKAQGWLLAMGNLEGRVEKMLSEEASTDASFLYRASEEVAVLISEAQNLAEEIAYTDPPLPFASFHTSLSELAYLYLETAKSLAIWLGVPDDKNRGAVIEKITEAKRRRQILMAYPTP